MFQLTLCHKFTEIFQQQGIVLRKKLTPQIPNIAFLYGGPKYSQQQRPAVQAGFIYKARPEPFKTYTRLQPQMQPSYNSYKIQPLLNGAYHQATAEYKPSIVTSDRNIFTPFLETNKLQGDFVPIFKSQNLPYKSYEADFR